MFQCFIFIFDVCSTKWRPTLYPPATIRNQSQKRVSVARLDLCAIFERWPFPCNTPLQRKLAGRKGGMRERHAICSTPLKISSATTALSTLACEMFSIYSTYLVRDDGRDDSNFHSNFLLFAAILCATHVWVRNEWLLKVSFRHIHIYTTSFCARKNRKCFRLTIFFVAAFKITFQYFANTPHKPSGNILQQSMENINYALPIRFPLGLREQRRAISSGKITF